jgi:hypothetical protein
VPIAGARVQARGYLLKNHVEDRTSIGANFWWSGHNANIKAPYTRIAPSRLGRQHQFTIQLPGVLFLTGVYKSPGVRDHEDSRDRNPQEIRRSGGSLSGGHHQEVMIESDDQGFMTSAFCMLLIS